MPAGASAKPFYKQKPGQRGSNVERFGSGRLASVNQPSAILSVAGSGACIFVYVAEICPPAQRQLFYSSMCLSVGLGMTTECAFAILFHWHTVSAIFAVMAIVGFAAQSMIPESPVWLRIQRRVPEAQISERWFGLDASEAGELDDERALSPPSLFSWSTFSNRTTWLPMIITVTFTALQQGCGVYVLFSYPADVLHDFQVKWNGMVIILFMSLSRVFGSVVFLLLNRINRKTLARISFSGMTTWPLSWHIPERMVPRNNRSLSLSPSSRSWRTCLK